MAELLAWHLHHVRIGCIAAFSLLVIAALVACVERARPPIGFAPVPLPRLSSGVIKLSVAHVVNDRFEKFSDAQIKNFLDALKVASRTELRREIEFDQVETFSIEHYFKPIPASKVAWRNAMIYDFKKGSGDRAQLEAAYEQAIARQTAPAKDWAAFAAHEIGLADVDTDPLLWKKRLADTHLQRLSLLANIKAVDGKPVIDATPYNEWVFWSTLGERSVTHDVVITNQLVAGAEYGHADIHPALRGGLTVGTTDFATRSQFGAQFWWSTFAFSSNDPVIVNMRGGERYEPLEAARLAGTLASHELGHLLFHYGHPFGVSACVMSPIPMLRFRETVTGLDAAACEAANPPGMKLGAADMRRPVYAAERK